MQVNELSEETIVVLEISGADIGRLLTEDYRLIQDLECKLQEVVVDIRSLHCDEHGEKLMMSVTLDNKEVALKCLENLIIKEKEFSIK